ncbi:hypothetical protein D9M68_655490 [compost metagenome]
MHETDQFDFLLFGLGAEDVQAVLGQCIQVELHVVQLDLPGFELGNVENLVDQRQQFVTRAVDGLHVVTLFDRQGRVEQQFGHAQHAVHWCADFVTDLGEEFGLGLEFGRTGGQCGALPEVGALDLPLPFGEREAEEDAAESGDAEDGDHQPAGVELVEAEQDRDECAEAEGEYQHADDDEARGLIAAIPEPAGHQQDAQGAE